MSKTSDMLSKMSREDVYEWMQKEKHKKMQELISRRVKIDPYSIDILRDAIELLMKRSPYVYEAIEKVTFYQVKMGDIGESFISIDKDWNIKFVSMEYLGSVTLISLVLEHELWHNLLGHNEWYDSINSDKELVSRLIVTIQNSTEMAGRSPEKNELDREMLYIVNFAADMYINNMINLRGEMLKLPTQERGRALGAPQPAGTKLSWIKKKENSSSLCDLNCSDMPAEWTADQYLYEILDIAAIYRAMPRTILGWFLHVSYSEASEKPILDPIHQEVYHRYCYHRKFTRGYSRRNPGMFTSIAEKVALDVQLHVHAGNLDLNTPKGRALWAWSNRVL